MEAETSINTLFDLLEENMTKVFENVEEERFKPMELGIHLPTGELNQNSIEKMREILSRKLRRSKFRDVREETTAAVQKSEISGLKKLRELSQLTAKIAADMLKPLEKLHEYLGNKVKE